MAIYEKISKVLPGFFVSLAIAIPSYLLGSKFPVVGGPVFAILIGMIAALFIKKPLPQIDLGSA